MYETTTLPEEFKQELFVEPNGEGWLTVIDLLTNTNIV
jgi:hypothetical protein